MEGSMSANVEKIRILHEKYESWKPKFPGVQGIGAAALQALMEEDRAGTGPSKLVLVDVRGVEEQEVSVISSSCTLTQAEFESRRDEFKDGDYTIVCYCTAGYRSGMYAAQLLREHGFRQDKVYNLEGSILAATQHGLPLVQRVVEGLDQPPKLVGTKRVHMWGPIMAGLQGEGYEPVMPGGPAALGLMWRAAWAELGRRLWGR